MIINTVGRFISDGSFLTGWRINLAQQMQRHPELLHQKLPAAVMRAQIRLRSSLR
jgi:hypothetical protein